MSETPVDRARLREMVVALKALAEDVNADYGGLPSWMRVNTPDVLVLCGLLDEMERVERERALVRGAMNADDERLRSAEARVWPDGRTYGCDAPQWLADAVLSLRAENAALRDRLWLIHGCPSVVLYGDDGERQCSACGVDFKREPVERLLRGPSQAKAQP